ncbi:MAG: carboxypeptidase regulatory-like domain-containing protein [Sedimentisphaerales bacterium]|nr:carboxypeptidase regulatory-like domain-containing protein [Sedimentisphaerales bacterium]
MTSPAVLWTWLLVLVAAANPLRGADARPPRAFEMNSPVSQAAGPAGLAGRVVDVQGRPIAGARVIATPGANLPLRQALRLEAYSDEDGVYRFEDALAETDYCLEFSPSAHAYQTTTARSGGFMVTTLGPVRVHRLAGSVCRAATGQKAAGATIVLIDEKGYARGATSGHDGSFEFDDVPDDVGQGTVYAYDGDLYSQYVMIRRGTISVDLTLDTPACLQGRCVAATSNDPLPGCRVTVRPPFVCGFALEAETAADGTYRFEPMPSGEYIVYARHAEWFQPPTRGAFLEPERILALGRVTSAWDIGMHAKSRVEGTVFGPDGSPAADAIVAVPTAIEPIHDTLYDLTRTGADGRFALYAHTLHPLLRTRSVEVVAFSDTLGMGTARVTRTDESDSVTPLYGDVEIKLAGRMRISGCVRDTAGTPLSDISAYLHPNLHPIRRTDASGFYDLGWFALPPNVETRIMVTFKGPRPHDGDMHTLLSPSEREPARPPRPDATYVLHTSLPAAVQHGGDAVLNATLTPADVLTFGGVVTDAAGSPVPQAQIMLFAGNADQNEWLNEMHPERMRGDGFVSHRRAHVPLARTVADAKGRFALHVVRESRASLEIGHFTTNIDPALFSLGVGSPDGAQLLLRDIRIGDDETDKHIEVRLR